MISDQGFAAVQPGAEVVTAEGAPVGRVVAVGATEVTVRDGREQRLLAIPRAAFSKIVDGRLRLRKQPVRSAGEGPARFVGDAQDEAPVVTVEGETPLHGHREGVDAADDIGDARDNAPTELPHGR